MRKLIQISLVALAASTATATTAASQEFGGTLTIAHVSAFPTSDPHFIQGQVNSTIYAHVYEMLVTVGEDMAPTLQLADSYEVSDDGLTYTFHLREGVPFHNGDIMTSADVLASWERYKEFSPGAKSLGPIVEMSAPDDMTFVFKLDAANPLFLESIISPTYPIAIIPEEENAKPQSQIDPIGTGPYKFAEIISDDRVVLERFEDYAVDEDSPDGFNGYAGKRIAYLDRIVFRVIPEANTRAATVEAGEADLTAIIPYSTLTRLVDTGRFQDITFRQFAKALFPMHTSSGPTTDVNFRKAVQAAMNAEEILAIAWEGISALDPSFLYSSSPYYDADNIAEFHNIGDPERAKELLADSTYDGEEVIITANANQGNQSMALVLREQLREAGINAEVNFTDNATFGAAMMDGTGGWHIGAVGYAAQPLAGPAAYFPILSAHTQMETNETFESLTSQWLQEPDVAERARIWQELEYWMFDNAYYLLAGDRGLTQVTTNAHQGFVPFYSMRFWNTWLEE